MVTINSNLPAFWGDITANPGKYSSDTSGWLEWLNADSGYAMAKGKQVILYLVL